MSAIWFIAALGKLCFWLSQDIRQLESCALSPKEQRKHLVGALSSILLSASKGGFVHVVSYTGYSSAKLSYQQLSLKCNLHSVLGERKAKVDTKAANE